jgi:hypothetical protein
MLPNIGEHWDLRVCQTYLKMCTYERHWPTDVILRTERRSLFVQKQINRFIADIVKAGTTTISDSDLYLYK